VTFVVDIGNTRAKWAHTEGSGLRDIGAVAHARSEPALLEAVGKGLRPEDRRIVAANVAGRGFAERLQGLARDRGLELSLVETAAERYGVRCAYVDPSRLGVDRWVGLVAAHRLIGGAACIIDSGTTVTLDAVTEEGRHLGGLIMAGPRMAAAALQRETGGIGKTLELVSVPSGIELLGRSTDEAVAHGAMLGVAAALDQAVATVAATLDAPLAVVLTGGGADALRPWLRIAVSYRPHFILEGLAWIASAP
jgi:type III pantothenate kinase